MMNIDELIQKVVTDYEIDDKNFRLEFSRFLVANQWFGVSIQVIDGAVCISNKDYRVIMQKSEQFLQTYNFDSSQRLDHLQTCLKTEFPDTADVIKRYFESAKLPVQSQFYISDFLLSYLPGELRFCTDLEIEDLIGNAGSSLTISNARILCDLIIWIRLKYRVAYRKDYAIKKRDMSHKHKAYAPKTYLKLMYTLLNAEHINDQDMYAKAAKSQRYTDCWLFMALHFVCALRTTDLTRIAHPKLPDQPQTVLDSIGNGTFSDNDARRVLASVLLRMQSLQLTPNKTKRFANVPSIKIHIPVSLEVHYGTLFALAEAHAQVEQCNPDMPLIKPIREYLDIRRAMGDDVAQFFVKANFQSKSATKAYLQTISDLTDDILGIEEQFHTKGYILASLARSHKSAYGDFARTTMTYLKDAQMSGYSPDFVARELLERGSLSFITDMLLKMTEPDYKALDVKQQTKLINTVQLSPYAIDNLVTVSDSVYRQAVETCKELYRTTDKQTVLAILHRIANGNAPGKTSTCSCLLMAIEQKCPFPGQGCLACKYEISTRSTMYLLVDEFNRLRDLYQTTNKPFLKDKHKALLANTVLPRIDEILSCISEQYGADAAKDFIEIVKGA